MSSSSNTLPPLWECPKCGAKLVTPNMSHSCGVFELDALFARCESHVFPLYKQLEDLVQSCGPVTIVPQKTRLVFQDRVRFIAVMPRKSWFLVHFWFTRRHDNPRFSKIEEYTPRAIVHFIQIHDSSVFDEEFKSWIREAYAVGQQKHLQNGRQ